MIKILDKNIADKIAAGEVVERPLSIVKELVENSIDAGSSSITAEIKRGGKTYIRVTDDGCGIPADEVKLAFMRHATGKISDESDLYAIKTLGFRGEALASIAAVSRIEIITKTKDEQAGSRLLIEGGAVAEEGATGCPEGTTIIARDLFYNTPARLKFMQTDNAESRKVIDFITEEALAYPEIRFRMISNDRTLFSTQGRGDRLRAVVTLSSREYSSRLMEVAAEADGMSLEGYVSDPGETRSNKRGQLFFVNGRPVNSTLMEKAVAEAYKNRVFHGRYPIAYLFLHVPPETLDVNIHPAKTEVRFHDSSAVESFVRDSLASVLIGKNAMPGMTASPAGSSFMEKAQNSSTADELGAAGQHREEKIKEGEQVDIRKVLSSFKNESEKVNEEIRGFRSEIKDGNADEPSVSDADAPLDFGSLEIIGTIFGTYIMAKDADTFYFIDQHAAHERIFFEHLMDQYDSGSPDRQQLLVPITVKASASEEESAPEWTKALEKLGFSLEEFGPDTWAVREIPAFFDIGIAEKFINDFMDAASDGETFENRAKINRAAKAACRNAVKAHDELHNEEIRRLLEDLSKCREPYSCPHGRPTSIKFDRHDIEKRFRRI